MAGEWCEPFQASNSAVWQPAQAWAPAKVGDASAGAATRPTSGNIAKAAGMARHRALTRLPAACREPYHEGDALLVEGKQPPPIVLHADDRPAAFFGLGVQRLRRCQP